MNMTTERKEKIKNIAIIFLIIMLILTLFSNTFMNRSLVEVSTQRVVSDSLTSKVRGSGYVESSDGYSVNIKETRKIATVGVKTGSDVEKGDVLFTLEDAESEELVAKRAEVATAEQAYEVAVLQAGLTVEQRNNIEAGRVSSINEKLTQKAAAQAAAAGKPEQLMSMMNQLMSTREGAQLIESISQQVKQAGLD